MQIHHAQQRTTDTTTLLPSVLTHDPRLSMEAIGVMAYIASFPDGHHLNADTIAADSPDGPDTVRRAMQELQRCGYLRMVPRRDEADEWHTDLHVNVYGDHTAGQVTP